MNVTIHQGENCNVIFIYFHELRFVFLNKLNEKFSLKIAFQKHFICQTCLINIQLVMDNSRYDFKILTFKVGLDKDFYSTVLIKSFFQELNFIKHLRLYKCSALFLY